MAKSLRCEDIYEVNSQAKKGKVSANAMGFLFPDMVGEGIVDSTPKMRLINGVPHKWDGAKYVALKHSATRDITAEKA